MGGAISLPIPDFQVVFDRAAGISRDVFGFGKFVESDAYGEKSIQGKFGTDNSTLLRVDVKIQKIE